MTHYENKPYFVAAGNKKGCVGNSSEAFHKTPLRGNLNVVFIKE